MSEPTRSKAARTKVAKKSAKRKGRGCEACGAAMGPEDVVCMECGYNARTGKAMASATTDPEDESALDRAERRVRAQYAVALGCLGLVLAGLGIGYVALFGGGSGGGPRPPSRNRTPSGAAGRPAPAVATPVINEDDPGALPNTPTPTAYTVTAEAKNLAARLHEAHAMAPLWRLYLQRAGGTPHLTVSGFEKEHKPGPNSITIQAGYYNPGTVTTRLAIADGPEGAPWFSESLERGLPGRINLPKGVPPQRFAFAEAKRHALTELLTRAASRRLTEDPPPVDETYLAAVRDCLRSDTPGIRAVGMEQAIRLGAKAVALREALTPLLGKGDVADRERAAVALAGLGPVVLADLEAAASDRSMGTRAAAAVALGQMEGEAERRRALLRGLLNDRYGSVTAAAIQGLVAGGMLEAPDVEAIAALLKGRNHDVRQAAAAALLELGPEAKSARTVLLEVLSDGRSPVRKEAVEILAGLPDPDEATLAALVDAAVAEGRHRTQVLQHTETQRAALTAVERLLPAHGPAMIPAIMKGLDSKYVLHGKTAGDLLTKIGRPALPALKAAAAKPKARRQYDRKRAQELIPIIEGR